MTATLDLNVVDDLINSLGGSLYFVILASENGVVKRSYINEDEFNKSLIALNIAQMYETAEEIIESIGLQNPDFNMIHTSNFFILSMKILDTIIIVLVEDQVEISRIFSIINDKISVN
jgi:predicted regulator of Ras-like GTPase activity (Roadblock/LC7/MglB family)